MKKEDIEFILSVYRDITVNQVIRPKEIIIAFKLLYKVDALNLAQARLMLVNWFNYNAIEDVEVNNTIEENTEVIEPTKNGGITVSENIVEDKPIEKKPVQRRKPIQKRKVNLKKK